MATDTAAEQEKRCNAVTGDGEQCTRPAGEDGFCFQHDESDGTVSDDSDAEETTTDESENSNTDMNDQEGSTKDDSTSDDAEDDSTSESDGGSGVMAVRDTLRENVDELLGKPMDGIVGIARTDDSWEATVEVIERRSVPDTQDIIGRYEIRLSDEPAIVGYSILQRYRRGDTTVDN